MCGVAAEECVKAFEIGLRTEDTDFPALFGELMLAHDGDACFGAHFDAVHTDDSDIGITAFFEPLFNIGKGFRFMYFSLAFLADEQQFAAPGGFVAA